VHYVIEDSMRTATGTSYSEQPPTAARPSLRPLALPTEHGGWGFLFEPIAVGLAVAPSWGGVLLALAFCFGFLTRQPLKLALQDLLRQKSYPRTRWCWILAFGYGLGGFAALLLAVLVSGWIAVVPIAMVVPLGLTQIIFDARNRSRVLLPELGGAVAMSSSAAAIAIAGGFRLLPAIAVSGILIARAIPAILHVRTLIQRKHGRSRSGWPSIAAHAVALAAVSLYGEPLITGIFALLFARAIWGLSRPVPAAKTIGWTEIAWGVATVMMVAVSLGG
jgi:hypothetical protein